MTSVCILSSPEDVHAQRVQEEVAALGGECVIVDLERGVQDLSYRVGHDSSGGTSLRLDDVVIGHDTTVWVRRPMPRAVDPRVVDRRLITFTEQQWRHAFHGALMATGCRIVNDPRNEQRANYKPWQLATAAACGMRVPRTLVTNAPDLADEFRAELAAVGKRTVFKPLTGLHYHLGETREFTADVTTGEELRLAPVIFQECVEKGTDLRVFVAGDRIVPSAVLTGHADLIDWRLDPLADHGPIELDPRVLKSISDVVAALGLDTASVDLRIDTTGEIYFFEANPSGQFLMLEQALGVNLSRILARHLLRR